MLLSPSPAFVASLPLGKIPDRNDFTRLGPEERVRAWEITVAASQALADDFRALLDSSAPLAGVTVLQ